MNNKIIKFLKIFGLYFLIVFVGTFLQIYWAMEFLAESISSSCLDCSFTFDTVMVSVMGALFLSPVFLWISRIGNLYFRVVLQFLLLASAWFFFDYTDFVERESSWSTYTFPEELFATLYHGFFPILVLSVVVLGLLNFSETKNKFKKTSEI